MTIRFINEIPEDMFTNLKSIATGSFSDIFSAVHVKTNTDVALKVSFITNSEEINLMDQEIKINKTLNHPFICKFFTEFDTAHLRILSMELVDGVSALEYVNKRHGLSISEARNIFTQLLISIEYLHNEAHITHRDLKLENIMIDSHDHIRLIDFGFSSRNPIMSTWCGSIPYCAPEILSGQKYSKEADIWSMGIVLFSLVHGDLPFYHRNIKTLIYLILHTKIVFPPDFPDDLCDILVKMLNKDPSKRIKLDEIKNHPFIQNEKFFQIDYKRLFSPSQNSGETDHDSIENIKCYKYFQSKSITALGRKGSHLSMYTPTNFGLKMSLHEKVNLKTDDVNLSIESRKNFSNDLNALIQLAFDPNSKYLLSKFKTRRSTIMIARSYDHIKRKPNLLQASNQLFQKSNQLFQTSGQLFQTSGQLFQTSDQLFQSSDQISLNNGLLSASENHIPISASPMSSRNFQSNLRNLNKSETELATTARSPQNSPPSNKKGIFAFKKFQPALLNVNKRSSSQSSDTFESIPEE